MNFRELKLSAFFIASMALAASSAQAEMLKLEESGVRLGVSDSQADQHFEQYEVFSSHALPWQWDMGNDWELQSRLNLSAGVLSASGGDGLVATIGPGLVLSKEKWNFFAGISPTYLGKDTYEVEDLGGNVHFTSHIGLGYKFDCNFGIAYRYQHMSNAGLEDENPGLNLHALEIKYHF